MYTENNSIVISKCSNGWQVNLPMPQPRITPGLVRPSPYMQEAKEFVPILREAMHLAQRDPVLAKIEEDNKEPDIIPVVDLIQTDPLCYVFAELPEALDFIRQRYQ
jgi:hypothetical protein